MYVKLVRDKVTAVNDRETVRPVNSKPGKVSLLCLKLHEEVDETIKDLDRPDEYADVLEVLQELALMHGVPWGAVEAARERKRKEKGGFEKGMVLVAEAYGSGRPEVTLAREVADRR